MDKNSSQSRMFWTTGFFLRLCHPAGNRCQRPRMIGVFYSETNAKPKPPKLTRIQGPSPFEKFWNIYKHPPISLVSKLLGFSGVCLSKIISSIMFVVPSPCQVGTDVQDRFMEDFDRWIASSWKVSECYYGVIMSSWLWAYYFDYLKLFEESRCLFVISFGAIIPKLPKFELLLDFLDQI